MQNVQVSSVGRTLTARVNDVREAIEPLHQSARYALNVEYAELKRIVEQAGLLDKQPLYYTLKSIFTFALLAVSLVVLITVKDFWWQMANAVFLAVVFAQIGFLGHDLGHTQITRTRWKLIFFGVTMGDLILGMSRDWWVGKHNRHHSNPNQEELDPDIDISVIAFTEEQARAKKGVARFITTYQAYFFAPLLTLQSLALHNNSITHVFKKRSWMNLVEGVLLGVHFVLYLGAIFYFLGWGTGLAFIVVHQMLFGLFLASVFAPNHKGMPILDKDSHENFLRRQVLTARNVRGHPFTDFWYGGLNYQIEHHLFPTMPRNKLRQAQKLVQDFCARHGIAYHETSVWDSYREILSYLHQVSAPLRAS